MVCRWFAHSSCVVVFCFCNMLSFVCIVCRCLSFVMFVVFCLCLSDVAACVCIVCRWFQSSCVVVFPCCESLSLFACLVVGLSFPMFVVSVFVICCRSCAVFVVGLVNIHVCSCCLICVCVIDCRCVHVLSLVVVSLHCVVSGVIVCNNLSFRPLFAVGCVIRLCLLSMLSPYVVVFALLSFGLSSFMCCLSPV